MDDRKNELDGRIIVWGTLFECGLAVIAIGAGALFSFDPLATLQWSPTALATGAAAALPPLGLMVWCVHSTFEPCRALTQTVDLLLLPLFRECNALELAMVSLAAGLGEEILFRGLIQGFVANWQNDWAGMLAGAVIFGLVHSITRVYVVMAIGMGLYLGGLWLLSGDLLAPIVTHALYDFCTLSYLLSRRNRLTKPGGTHDDA